MRNEELPNAQIFDPSSLMRNPTEYPIDMSLTSVLLLNTFYSNARSIDVLQDRGREDCILEKPNIGGDRF
jgi:hypothetical protein